MHNTNFDKVIPGKSVSNVELGNLQNVVSGPCPDCSCAPCQCDAVASTANYHLPEEVDGDTGCEECDGTGTVGAHGDEDIPCSLCSARAAEDRAVDAYEDAMDRD